ncbi:hypothetical protein V1477_010943 [Vespula maculifrons]|uniref:Uncharacterized protein n=1 Tax=Vespula maculifrons TaxID=7453 RepID=A0ABD2C3D7_VESMC
MENEGHSNLGLRTIIRNNASHYIRNNVSRVIMNERRRVFDIDVLRDNENFQAILVDDIDGDTDDDSSGVDVDDSIGDIAIGVVLVLMLIRHRKIRKKILTVPYEY